MKYLIFYLILMNSAFAIDCHKAVRTLLNKNASAPSDELQFKLLKQVQELEKKTNRLRIKKTNQEPAINLRIWKKIATYDALLASNNYSQITREIRPLFREVETAVVVIGRYEKVISLIDQKIFTQSEELISYLKSNGVQEDLANAVGDRFEQTMGDIEKMKSYFNSVIQENAVHLGHFYHEYKLIRNHLENLANGNACDAKCSANVKRLLESVGVESSSDQERFHVLIKNAKRPTFTELSETLNSHPLAYTTRLKRERDEEFILFIRGLFYELLPLDAIEKLLLQAPGLSKSKAVRLFSTIYDRTARLVHFPKVNQIMRSPQDVPAKFDLFLELNTTIVPEDELMVTFARRIDSKTKDTWEKLFSYAKENSERYPDISMRMTKAKEKAKARGEISLIHEKSFTTKLAIIASAGGSIAYYYFNKEDVSEVIDDINVFDSELAPTDEEQDTFSIDASSISIKLGSQEDKELDSTITEVTESLKDINLPERTPDSKKTFEIPLRIIKEI